MATDPAFGSTPVAASALLGAAETTLIATSASKSTLFTVPANGMILDEIVINAAAASLAPAIVAGLVYIFLVDASSNYILFDTLSIPLPASAASSTVPPLHLNKYYTEAIPGTWLVKASQSIVGNASLLQVTAFGGNL